MYKINPTYKLISPHKIKLPDSNLVKNSRNYNISLLFLFLKTALQKYYGALFIQNDCSFDG